MKRKKPVEHTRRLPNGKIIKINKGVKKKKLPCPGSKIRSKGLGRGLGIGKGQGPINRRRYLAMQRY